MLSKAKRGLLQEGKTRSLFFHDLNQERTQHTIVLERDGPLVSVPVGHTPASAPAVYSSIDAIEAVIYGGGTNT